MQVIMKQEEYYPRSLTLSCDCVSLLEWIQKKGYPIKATVCATVGYYANTKTDLSLPFSEEAQLVSLRAKVRSNTYSRPTGFKLWGYGNGFRVRSSRTKFGWYKRPGFDAAYTAMKAMIPDLNEVRFARFELPDYDRGGNEELTECRPYTPDSGHVLKEYVEDKEPRYYTYHIQSLYSALAENMEPIKSLLREMEGDYII